MAEWKNQNEVEDGVWLSLKNLKRRFEGFIGLGWVKKYRGLETQTLFCSFLLSHSNSLSLINLPRLKL